jgi:hypothetical protein
MQLRHARRKGERQKCGLHALERTLQVVVIVDIADQQLDIVGLQVQSARIAHQRANGYGLASQFR